MAKHYGKLDNRAPERASALGGMPKCIKNFGWQYLTWEVLPVLVLTFLVLASYLCLSMIEMHGGGR
ncbi:hypothetical protein BKA82DRAFT_1000491 [Pisolithus tinctorius]|uniref:Uncharacterized protein n=1 Tax=Pisolithus tinctorius Marx 270 TaxID=870435 RepID=A0A0C3NUU0_PISTI|nr:hypothetical protein BKA82DRAFT_1000491 [Pisolithus tinctorius]KIO04650.1 hypothetical protein M404DRAFT_1000491 [Pisolithus tinctorius Marx 270]